MNRLTLLKDVSFGSRVAEDETQQLSAYFVETDQWNRIGRGEVDIIKGEKGSGKSAIYTLLAAKTNEFFDKNILLVTAETPRGNTVFRDLVSDPPTSEQEFMLLWKLYIATLIGERLRDLGFNDVHAVKVFNALGDEGLLPKEFEIRSILRKVYKIVKSLFNVEALEISGSIEPNTGMPVATGRLTLREPTDEKRQLGFMSVDSLFEEANESLRQKGYKLWIAFDRLDVAFAENLELEANALRALMRVYADLRHIDCVAFKIFLREDIWRRISEKGFRESSHLTRAESLRWT
ncbi:MAG: hypothetical protein WAK01_16195, partial [Methylocystis sp.]